MKKPIIRITDLRKNFGTFEALKGVSLDFAEGEVVCLLGPSGSGKSTLLRCINQLETTSFGFVRLRDEFTGFRAEGQKLHVLGNREIARQRARIGMVFQQFNLFPHKTTLENITEGPILVKSENPQAARAEAMTLLARVGLAHKAHSYPGSLSGGQQQRVAIARALAMKPEVILFDEPISALDPELVGEVLAVMKELAHSGLTMIIVTHEIGFARDVADRIVFMNDGQIIESGRSTELLNNPQHERTREFLEAVRH